MSFSPFRQNWSLQFRFLFQQEKVKVRRRTVPGSYNKHLETVPIGWMPVFYQSDNPILHIWIIQSKTRNTVWISGLDLFFHPGKKLKYIQSWLDLTNVKIMLSTRQKKIAMPKSIAMRYSLNSVHIYLCFSTFHYSNIRRDSNVVT